MQSSRNPNTVIEPWGMTRSPLALLMARIRANHVHPPMAANQLAVLTNALYTGTNFHKPPSLPDFRRRSCGNFYCTKVVKSNKGISNENRGFGTQFSHSGP
jgi:hypothetical protein